MNFQPYHETRERDKLNNLIASMSVNGWLGGPIVVDGEQAITGSHRLAAARSVNKRWEANEDVQRVEVETVGIDELFTMAGLDFSATSEAAPEGIDYYLWLVNALPYSIREEYGIDLH